MEAGDGTTSVVVLAGAFAGAAESLLDKGIHPSVISQAFLRAERKAQEILDEMSIPVQVTDETSLINAGLKNIWKNINTNACIYAHILTLHLIASTSLNSKVVNQYSQTLAPLAVKAVLKVFIIRLLWWL